MRKTYSETHLTDVPWAGIAPSHWQDTKFKFLLIEKKKTQNLDLPAGSISFGTVVEKDSEKLMEETLAAYQELLEGEFIINPLNLNFDLKSLRTAFSDKNVVVSSGYIIAKSTGVADKGFLRWLLHQFDVSHMKTLGAGIRQTINFGDIANSKAVLPPAAEQRYITAFLNSETQRIDGLIDEKQRFIDLLKEKRQALISHFVTKGLDANVPMKDSGVEWIGEVPEHWEKTTFKFLISKIIDNRGRTPPTFDLGIPLLEAKQISTGGIEPNLSFDKFIDSDGYSEFIRDDVIEGDVLMVTVGSIGNVSLCPRDTKFVIAQNIVGFRSTANVINKFLYYYLCSDVCLAAMNHVNKLSVLSSVKVSNFIQHRLVLPSSTEQSLIVEKLDIEVAKIDNLLSEVSKSIDILREHRTALISAAVTGKIDVRGMVYTKEGAA